MGRARARAGRATETCIANVGALRPNTQQPGAICTVVTCRGMERRRHDYALHFTPRRWNDLSGIYVGDVWNPQAHALSLPPLSPNPQARLRPDGVAGPDGMAEPGAAATEEKSTQTERRRRSSVSPESCPPFFFLAPLAWRERRRSAVASGSDARPTDL
ncbi:unnamed protein product [Lampetra fluviatilis]